MPTDEEIQSFQQTIWDYYAHGRRELPWRRPEPDGQFDPYKILVSEIMLQQTQVNRVIPKFIAFVEAYPSVQALAAAPLSDVLIAWSGLGYNRRAKFLWQAAKQIVGEWNGIVPKGQKELTMLSGIGVNTAGAIAAYAYNKPVLFIETNVRTVLFHHFFQHKVGIPDKDLLPILAASLMYQSPRDWYWALMDYGTYLKQTHGNLARASAHYVKQSTFAGSRRQIRGQVLRLLSGSPLAASSLAVLIPDERLPAVLSDLEGEGFIGRVNDRYHLST